MCFWQKWEEMIDINVGIAGILYLFYLYFFCPLIFEALINIYIIRYLLLNSILIMNLRYFWIKKIPLWFYIVCLFLLPGCGLSVYQCWIIILQLHLLHWFIMKIVKSKKERKNYIYLSLKRFIKKWIKIYLKKKVLYDSTTWNK